MLKELFEASFFITYPCKSGIVINISEDSYTSPFYLRDEKACRDCKFVCSDDISDRVQLYVISISKLNVLNVDNVVSNIKDSVGDTCDYLLDDGNVSSLVEMTCSNTEYVGSKRQKARKQLYNTLCIFYANPDVRRHFETEKHKYVIFSWKDTTPKLEQDDSIASSMIGMTLMSDASYSPQNISKFDFGFMLKEIRYPDPLNWADL